MSGGQFSLLSGEEIKSMSLVDSAVEAHFRASTYDLSVGEIIPDDGEEFGGNDFSLPSGGMVRVVSKELLKLPDTITGHVLLKNDLCKRGVLAINIGVVDPGFEGPISSNLINFGRGPCTIKKGTSFLRVSFHRCPASTKAQKSEKHTREAYLKRAEQEVKAYSGKMFLSIDEIAAHVANKVFGEFKNRILLWAGLVTVVLALLAVFAPLGASIVDNHIASTELRDAQEKEAIEHEIEARYEARLKTLSDQIDQLQQTITKAGPKNAPSIAKQSH